jgi:uncharacterized membrane protein
MQDAQRLERVERRTEDLAERVWALEGRLGVLEGGPAARCAEPGRAGRPQQARPAARGASSRPASAPPQPPLLRPAGGRPALEDLLGGQVLAWTGGVAVLVAIALSAAIAVSHGWIGPVARAVLAGALSAGLIALGTWWQERRGGSAAARAASATGVAGLFVTAVLAGRVYAILPLFAALALAAGAAAAAVALALRWDAQPLAALGVLGGLAAPPVVGASGPGTLVLVWIMGAAAAAILLGRRWDWLALAAALLVTPQCVAWVLEAPASSAAALVALVAFGALGLATAVGFELRTAARELRFSAAFLAALNAAVLAGAGWLALSATSGARLAEAWLAALAAAHLLAALWARRGARVSVELVTLLAVLGVVLGDVALATVVHGPAQPLVWTAGALLAAAVARLARSAAPVPRLAADLGVGAHVALAVAHALVDEAPPGALGTPGAGNGVLLAIAAACLASGRLAGWRSDARRLALDLLGLASVSYLLAGELQGGPLAAAWAAEAVALAGIARRTGAASAGWAAAANLLLAAGYALAVCAPPGALLGGLEDPLGALQALGAVAAAAVVIAGSQRLLAVLAGATGASRTRLRAVLLAGASAAVLHLASVELVAGVGAHAGGLGASGQLAQMLLSGLWSAVGAAALLAGLGARRRELRLAGLGLLLLTAGKVFAFDLAALDSGWRVGSLLVCGLLLLGGAFAWQRLRPAPLPDLRRMPPALR